ncbi:MAG: hypothetical protein Alpg2KO_02280 [Alphaproteobacteria bacterium]
MNRQINSIFRRLATVLGTAIILYFGSEFLFYNEQPVRDILQYSKHPVWLISMLAEGILFYLIVGYAFCIIVHRYQQTWSSILLCGALLGWVIESIIHLNPEHSIPIPVFNAIPFSFLWPSIGWHAVMVVVLCWVGLRQLMFAQNWWGTLLGFAGLGAFWAFWATWFWLDSSAEAMPPLTFSQYVTYTLCVFPLLPLGLFLLDWKGTHNFQVTNFELYAGLSSVLLLTLIRAESVFPTSLALLPVVFITLFALERGRPYRMVIPPLEAMHKDAPPRWHYALTLAMPVMAIATYALMLRTGPLLNGDAMIGGMMLIGTAAFVYALVNCIMMPVAAQLRPQLPKPTSLRARPSRAPHAQAKPINLDALKQRPTQTSEPAAKEG